MSKLILLSKKVSLCLIVDPSSSGIIMNEEVVVTILSLKGNSILSSSGILFVSETIV